MRIRSSLLPFAVLAFVAPAAAAAQIERDVFIVSIDLANGKVGEPRDITLRPGYEDQAAWLPDGSGLLYVVQGEDGNTEVFRYDLASDASTQVTATPEAEYSPTPLADGSGFSAVRVERPGSADPEVYTDSQRLFRYGYDGKPIAPVHAAWRRVGYHAWVDDGHLALFLVGGGPNQLPNTLVYASVVDGKQLPLAKDIGRSLGRSPDGRPTFVDQGDPARWTIVTLLPGEAKPTVITATPRIAGESEDDRSQDFRWLPDGTLLMGSHHRLMRFDPREPAAGWTTFAEFADLPGDIKRIAVSADGKRLAFGVELPVVKTRGIRG